MTPTKEAWDKLFDLISERQRLGMCVIETIEGLREMPIEDMVNQPVEGLLYDLNRGEEVTRTLKSERSVNDLAVAQVIRYLKAKVDKLEGKKPEYE